MNDTKRARVLEAVKSSTEIVGPTLIFDISDALEIAHGSTDMLPRALEVIGPKLSVLLNRPLSEDTIKDAAKIITDSILGLETISVMDQFLADMISMLATVPSPGQAAHAGGIEDLPIDVRRVRSEPEPELEPEPESVHELARERSEPWIELEEPEIWIGDADGDEVCVPASLIFDFVDAQRPNARTLREELSAEIRKLEAQSEKATWHLGFGADLVPAAAAASRQINELRRKLADRDDTIANLDRKIEDATKSFETITSDLVSAQERARARELERDQLEARNAELETENAKLREKLDVFQSPESYPNHAFDNVEDHRDYLAHWNAQLGDQLQKTKDQVAVEKAEIRAVKATAEMDKKFQIENFERASRRVRELQIKLVNMDLERALIKTSRRDIEDNAVEKLRNIRNAVEALVSDGQIKTWHASKILDLF